jgi:hypothetical protein
MKGVRCNQKHHMNTQYERARSALPLPQLMRLLGVPKDSIRANDGDVRCPWHHRHRHNDQNKSCSIYRNMTRIHCFVCGYNYDVVHFVAAWRKSSAKEAYGFFMKNAEGRRIAVQDDKYTESEQGLALPQVWDPTPTDLEVIASLRQIDVEALQMTVRLGILRRAKVCTEPSWLLTDSAGCVAEGRTLSGAWYPAFGSLSERKAHTIRGSKKSWPVGSALLQQYPSITSVMLLEGGPDLLAAYHFLLRFGFRNVLPVAMLGANAGRHGIDPRALQLFRGKHVRIYPHNDSSGLDGLINWLPQLKKVGCTVSRASFAGITRPDGTPANDLNDLTSRLPGTHEPYRFLFI